jgi:hypothetical protein
LHWWLKCHGKWKKLKNQLKTAKMKSKFLLTLLSGIITLSALAQKPVILRFEPKTGTKGTKVYIFGKNLGSTKSVYFKNVPAGAFQVMNDTTVIAMVGDGATGMVSLSTTYGEAALGEFIYTATPPSNCDLIRALVPNINKIQVESTHCFRDSMIKLTVSNGEFKSYRWSTGDTTPFIWIKSSQKVSVTVGNAALGCFSKSSPLVRFIRNTLEKPTLSFKDSTLSSTKAPMYRWFFNGEPLKDKTQQIKATKIGIYRVETSADEICWTSSNEFKLSIGSLVPESDSLAVKVYPNPSAGEFKVAVVLPKEQKMNIQITVLDATGTIVYKSPLLMVTGREIHVPLHIAKKGIYSVRVDVNGKMRSRTLFIQ